MTDDAERYEDMSPLGRLRVIQQEDGDMILAVVPDPNGIQHYAPSVEFCSCGGGGGQSPHTLAALRNLLAAIKKDNEEREQVR